MYSAAAAAVSAYYALLHAPWSISSHFAEHQLCSPNFQRRYSSHWLLALPPSLPPPTPHLHNRDTDPRRGVACCRRGRRVAIVYHGPAPGAKSNDNRCANYIRRPGSIIAAHTRARSRGAVRAVWLKFG